MSNEIVPFGKHKGKPVGALIEDRAYVEWLTAQAWFREKYGNVYNIVINNGAEPSETPEHNAMQIKFLDEDYRHRLALLVCPELRDWAERFSPEDVKAEMARIQANIESAKKKYGDDVKETGERTQLWPLWSWVKFEASGYDVVLTVDAGMSLQAGISTSQNLFVMQSFFEDFHCYKETRRNIGIEIKPTMGDDYPAVLRQMKRGRDVQHQVLLLGEYTGRGATLDQVRAFFLMNGIKLVFDNEIPLIKLPSVKEDTR